MAWLLDTNTCIYIIKKKPVSVFEKFKTLSPGQIGLSVITMAELEYGARKSASSEKNLSSLHQFLIPFDIFSFDYILVTNNEKEFSRVNGLQIENWVK